MTRFAPLPRRFYEPSAELVAPRLLGHWLIRNTPTGPCGGVIVETEAYHSGDPASHAYRGRTARNRVMFGAPGHAYVYFIYGCHYCVNAVCRPAGMAEAVLIRAVEPAFGEKEMLHRRPVGQRLHLTNGPAKLCQALNIDRELDGVDLCDAQSALFIARNPKANAFRKQQGPPLTTPRIGITRATTLQLRFLLPSNPFVSI